jgi:hypothetical protein
MANESQKPEYVQTLVIPEGTEDSILEFLQSKKDMTSGLTGTQCVKTLALVEGGDYDCPDTD